MRKTILLLALLLSICTLRAQSRLSVSATNGPLTEVYQLTDKETELLILKPLSLTDAFLHTLVDRYDTKSGKPRALPYGNYLSVQAQGNQLHYTLIMNGNTRLSFINNKKEFQFSITDPAGKPVVDATVFTARGKRLYYNPAAHLYRGRYPSGAAYLKIVHKGVSSYFTYDSDDEDVPGRPSFRKRIRSVFPVKQVRSVFVKKPSRRAVSTGPGSFFVFSKPKYKPYDTVRFKAYLFSDKKEAGKRRPLQVLLSGPSGQKQLTLLNPYRDGGYEYQFVLADSLKLMLDQPYKILLMDSVAGRPVTRASGNFYYEEYELNALRFAVRTDKKIQYPGQPIAVYMKATDENELAVPDARVEIVARTQGVASFYKDVVFVPDTLWKTTVSLDPVGETRLFIPDSIFPEARLSYSLHFKMLNSNNETRTADLYLNYDQQQLKDSGTIAARFVKDSLYLEYQKDSIRQPQAGWLYTRSGEQPVDSQRVQLPLALQMNYQAAWYELVLDNGVKAIKSPYQFDDGIEIAAVHSEKQVHLAVANEHKIPFWYTVLSGSDVLLRGYGTTLDTVINHTNKRAAHFHISYFWNDAEQQKEVSSFYNAQILNIKLLAPEVIYPGQKVHMKVAITDARNKPVPGADLTAYAHTAKFNSVAPFVRDFGRSFYARNTWRVELEGEAAGASGNIRMNWQKWGRQLGLDTIEYYRFTNPRGLYLQTEAIKDSLTQFAPFVVNNGAIEPVSIVYVDEVPVYFEQAQQLQHYAFRITPGAHSIRLRTPEHEVWIRDFYFKKGMRTVFSVEADTLNTQARVTRLKNILTPVERQRLHPYFLRVQDNFNDGQTFIRYDSIRLLLNPPGTSISWQRDLLVGPIRTDRLFFQSELIDQLFTKEPGFVYTFSPGLIKQKSYPGMYTFDTLLRGNNALSQNYRQQVLRNADIDTLWNDFFDLRSRTTQLFSTYAPNEKTTGTLRFYIDTAFTNQLPYIKNIILTDPSRPHFLQVYNGAATAFAPLLPGHYQLLFLLKDNRYFKADNVQVTASGINYYSWSQFKIHPADSFTLSLDRYIKEDKRTQYGYYRPPVPEAIIRLFNKSYFNPEVLHQEVKGVVMSFDGKPIGGATVEIQGLNQQVGTVTDKAGRFRLKIPERGTLAVSALGYLSKQVEAGGRSDTIILEDAKGQLNEVVVVGYGTQRKSNLTGAVTSISNNRLSTSLSGRVAGVAVGDIQLRGTGTLPAKNPMILVDGLPFDGDISALNPDDIEQMNILKEADATAIYGSRGANGVVIVKTKKGNSVVNESGVLQEGAQTLRARFSDEGFWQPRLVTDASGEASFTVTFPDDITSWKTRLIALTGERQSGYLEQTIRSFKTLSANFVAPQFAVEGDSMNVIGKLMNYTPIPEKLVRSFRFMDTTLRNSELTVMHAHLDTVMIGAQGKDSLHFEYALKQSNGYFDGERRSIPLYPAGVKETVGWFSVLLGDTALQYRLHKDKGAGIVRAETSVFPVLLDEMKRLRDYEYLCNEQLASKLKSLLLEKKLRAYMKEPFPYEKSIRVVLKKLDDNKSTDGLWGWWQGTVVEPWISLHVVEALMEAQRQGYTTTLNTDLLYRYLQAKVADQGADAHPKLVRLLAQLNGNQVLRDWIRLKEADTLYQKRKKTLYEQLELLELKQQGGLTVRIDSLVKLHKQTMFGGIYWGEDGWRFWNNSIQNTLMMYRILRRAGGHTNELSQIRQYFLEQRKDGQWRNTYESSLILETILPELFDAEKKPKPAVVEINRTRFDKFPFEQQYEAGTHLQIKKEGDMPVYITAYQQFQNRTPQAISKDFTVNSRLIQDNQDVQVLKAGKTALLRVEVTARADADYVMIEIPIPAGCSYENKMQRFWGVETHREYFKNKTAIFCTKMQQGSYTFDIQLMPRYTGNYILNPAKAELMYYPVFYGRETMKKVTIH
ncbi:carboxypeptidase-like regulatory domain-containing protein [Niabella pedocola]|uniref:Carboxypeptidase-like regulatory domain-containing protein n=1 Tax=Niabella pedocola TaxID=1752077 RepID=A0ABS8PKP0_9BACT|nr:alpha-2-macroglobulin family protein [Niabella pedocola]MCD2421677.1 carboxypeptidase-like regulatory domain-containing protein [Niabella pedocola]